MSSSSSGAKERPELVGKRFLYVPHDDDGHLPRQNRGNSAQQQQEGPAAPSKRRGEDPSERKLKLSRIADWNWISGVIRCASHADERHKELQVGHGNLFR